MKRLLALILSIVIHGQILTLSWQQNSLAESCELAVVWQVEEWPLPLDLTDSTRGLDNPLPMPEAVEEVEAIEQVEEVLAAELTTPEEPVELPAEVPANPPPPIRPPRRQARKIITSKPPPVPVTLPIVEEKQSNVIPARASSTKPFDSSAYGRELRRRIESKKRYPMLARQRGLEGSVTLGFSLDAGGRLSGSRITRSSGQSILDEAAMQALRAASPFHSRPDGQNTSLQVTLIFRLGD